MENSKVKFHLIDIKALIKEFREDKLDEHKRFQYLMGYLLLGLISLAAVSAADYGSTLEWFLTSSISTIIMVAGTILAYRKNKEGDNKDFITRYVALGFVTSVRLGVLFLSASLVFGIILGALQNAELLLYVQENVMFGQIYNASYYVIFFVLLIRYIKQISVLEN